MDLASAKRVGGDSVVSSPVLMRFEKYKLKKLLSESLDLWSLLRSLIDKRALV